MQVALLFCVLAVRSSSVEFFAEFQSLPTNGAHDWEAFEISGEPYLAVANHVNDGGSYNIESKIYKWDGAQFAEFQSINTSGARDWEAFEIDGEPYLAVANHVNDGASSNYTTNSKVYKWNGTNFAEFQSFLTRGAYDWEAFEIAGETYLAGANYRDGKSFDVDSKVYKWDGTSFAEFQSIPTWGAVDWEAFEIAGEPYLVVANYWDGVDLTTNSKVYKWNGASFAEFESISTSGANDWESFEIAGETYLVVANGYAGNGLWEIDSKMYKWSGATFVEFQSFPTARATDCESFEIAGERYLAVSNSGNLYGPYNFHSKVYKWNGAIFAEEQSVATLIVQDCEAFEIAGEPYLVVANFGEPQIGGVAVNTDSKVYKWNRTSIVPTPILTASQISPCAERFVEFQSFPTRGGSDWQTFAIGGERYLAVANYKDGRRYAIDSKVYKWNGVSFSEFQGLPTIGAVDWEAFEIAGESYLAVANYFDGTSYDVDSKVYRWNGAIFAEFQSLRTSGAHDWEAFEIAGDSYLAVANRCDGPGTNYIIDSKVYKWNGESFAEFQSIPTGGAVDWEAFKIAEETYLVVANRVDKENPDASDYMNTDSTVYKWNGTSFAEFQSLPTQGARDWEAFEIAGESYLAVANGWAGQFKWNIASKIYKWDATGFTEFQSITTQGAQDWAAFEIAGVRYLAVANGYGFLGNAKLESKVYYWNGARFAEFQRLATNQAQDWEAFEISGEQYLAVANYKGESSMVYKCGPVVVATSTSAPTAGPSAGSPAAAQFVEFQSLPTRGAKDWETLAINGETYLAVANRDDFLKVYKWNGASFAEYQSIPTLTAVDLEAFEIAGKPYLAVANHRDGDSYNTNSEVYSWNGASFAEFQSLPTRGARDIEAFEIGGGPYLAVANYWDGDNWNIDSKIYKWNGASFVEFQSLPTRGAQDWKAFQIRLEPYLVVANGYGTESMIFKWNGTSFEEFQSFPSRSAHDVEAFAIAGERYLVLSNLNDDSKIHKWNGTSFEDFQSLRTGGAYHCEALEIGGEPYLVTLNREDGARGVSRHLPTKIYKWNGASFAEFQSLPTRSAQDCEAFEIDGEPYLAVANDDESSWVWRIDSKIYKWEVVETTSILHRVHWLVGLCMTVLACFMIRRRTKTRSSKPPELPVYNLTNLADVIGRAETDLLCVVSFSDLEVATDHFSESRKIGEGGFSTVYKAESLPSLSSQTAVAIKRFSSDQQHHMIDAFHAEIQLLGTYCHENLIPLLGFCMDKIPCLVYPLIVGGNLDDRLSLSDEARRRLQALDCTTHHVALTWRERLYILRGVCRALMYLHTASGTKGVVLHRDVKPLNILLDEQIIPKLSDVGLAKQSQELRDGARTHLSTSVIAGTRGFIDPLFITSGQYSQMTDAYAFGVTILICLTGMPAPQAMELEMLEHVSFAPRSVDISAHWPDNVAIAMAELVKGLSWQRTKNDRMSLEMAFLRLEELAEEHVRFDVADEVPNGCVVCRSKPRSVRFVCGHCNCCRDCAAALVERGDPCPTCRAPIHVIARGAHLAGEPTYVGRVEEPVE